MRRTLLALLAASPWLAHAADPTPQQRATAARLTAEKAAACVAVQPFYWELGNAAQPLVGGKAGEGAPDRRTEMAIASASKWVYAAFAAERRQGQFTADDIKFLNFQSGYTHYRFCLPNQSVAACQASLINGRGRKNPATENRFDYGGGHMQQHALTMGLGSLGPEGAFTETTPYDPRSPYSASKAASDHLARAWATTFALPVIIKLLRELNVPLPPTAYPTL